MAELLIASLDQTFQQRFPLPEHGVLKVGREEDSDIRLPRPSVSRLHARIHCSPDGYQLEDTGSRNGVILNGARLEGTRALNNGDKFLVGEFAVMAQLAAAPAFAANSKTEEAESATGKTGLVGTMDDGPGAPPAPAMPRRSTAISAAAPGGAADPFARPEEQAGAKVLAKPNAPGDAAPQQTDAYVTLRSDVHRELIGRMDLRQMNFNELGSDEVRQRTQRVIEQIIYDFENEKLLPRGTDKAMLLKDVIDEALGLGPLEDLLADEDISEIMVNNKDQIFIERKGKLTLSDKKFISDRHIRAVIERIVAPLGRRIDESSPMVDARLADGSRVNAIIPPLAIRGSCITIRKFKKDPLKVDDLIKFGAFTRGIADFFQLAVSAHCNIVISGGTGSGKTTLLNVMSSFIGNTERIVTVEDAAELQLRQPHVVSLEARPANIEGKGQVTIRDLVKNCLRMRPDRIVIGECRGGEALDMLQAMNTGHDGSLTTGHANSPREMLSRLETMVLMAGMDLPVRAIREQIASAVHVIVQQARLSDGSRRVTEVTEVTGMEGDIITTQTIFKYQQTGFDPNGKIIGRMVPSGFIPGFVEKLRSKGIAVDMGMFQA